MGSSCSSRRQPLVQRDRDTAGSTNVALHQPCVISRTIPQIPNERTVELCNRCREIDLDDFFWNEAPGMTRKPKEVLYLGRLEKETTCELCQFFYSMRCQHPHDRLDTYILRSFLFGRKSARSAVYFTSHYAPSRVLCVFPGKPTISEDKPGFVRTFAEWPPLDKNWILPQSSTAAPFFSHEKPSLSALPFSTTSINYPLLRAWCEQCDSHHSTCASARKAKHRSDTQKVGPAVRCIDCHTREIVEMPTSARFFALSYVWGEQPSPGGKCTLGARKKTSIHGTRQLPNVIPKVIEDAMIVVANLGERYLWVDQYCIDQNDADDKHAQIGNMAAIYEGAYATIVAFSATDSASGLPGVRNLAKKSYFSVAHSKPRLSAIRPSAINSSQMVESSVWMARGWTYQEAILSRRLLIFTDYQVEFICSNAVWHECTIPGTGEGFYLKPRVYRPGSPNYLREITPMERPAGKIPVRVDVLAGCIEVYSGRHLTYQSDALNAITGLLSRISTFTYLGIPILDQVELATSLSRTLVVEEALWQFLTGLAWFHADKARLPLRRRDAFPSWSWLGWEGPINLPRPITCNKNATSANPKPRARASVWIMNQVTHTKGDILMPLTHFLEEPQLSKELTSILPHLTNYLWVEGQVLRITLTVSHWIDRKGLCTINSVKDIDHPLTDRRLTAYRVSFRNCCLHERYINRPLSTEIDERTFECTEQWDFLLLSTQESKFPPRISFFLLILDQVPRDENTEAEDCYCAVGSAKLVISCKDGDPPWEDPSRRRRIKLC